MKLGSDENGHRTLDGARWHYPSNSDPAVCGEKDCDYVMKAYRDKESTQCEKKPRVPRRRRSAST
jgi:hypothetical protein